MTKKYLPFVVQLPKSNSNIFDHEPELQFSSSIEYPRFDLGFHYYIHANKNKMEILNEFQNKKKVYLVMNSFERYIDNYEEDIGHTSVEFFGIKKDKPNILSRGFYKLWEIFFMFDIIDLNRDKFVSAHLAEGPGSFIQATMFFRDKYSKHSKNDNYYAVTIHPENGESPLEKSFIDYYDNEKPKRVLLHKTFPKQTAGKRSDIDNGDITDPKTVKLFGGQIGNNKADLITADGGFEWTNENTQEQEAYRLIFSQIYAAFTIQKKGGSFVCKFFETFTKTSLKLLYMLNQLYSTCHVVKPLSSRPSNSERYVVCMGFLHSDTDSEYKKIHKKFESIMNSLKKNEKKNLVGLWHNFTVPTEFVNTVIYSNTSIANVQLKSINRIVEFIKAQNYYGDVYQYNRQLQIEASKYWIFNFFPADFGKSVDNIRQQSLQIVKHNKELVDGLTQKISQS